ncbi:MAG: hypothetical protein IKS41_00630 [Alphaproteobacteria bacterium]|nr:hypothetical protein [Alphaproteobacteria bacterium]
MTKQNKETPEILPEQEPVLQIPDKFKDKAGDLNTAALIKSYLELEKKMAARAPNDPQDTCPENPEGYTIQINSELMKNDPDVNKRLFDLGLTRRQAQGIYDLAAEKIIPVIQNLSETFKMDKDLSALSAAFGGEEQFNTVARQISAWGEKNLNPKIFEALSTSKDGILAMYQMMKNGQETPVLSRSENLPDTDTEEDLKRLMQNPKYWKYQDPEITKRVEAGFKRLYG